MILQKIHAAIMKIVYELRDVHLTHLSKDIDRGAGTTSSREGYVA